ncbi:portal protein [Pseudorhodobacter antarcticus]|nr:portal protein [Pseudorhodobacter antarcticus]
MKHPDPTAPHGDLAIIWTAMETEKGDLIQRSENYARLTLPYICAPESSASSEQDRGAVAIGPRVVNHLANKVVDTMFPKDRPFFTVALTPETRKKISEEVGTENEAAFAELVRTETANVEQAGMRKMGLTTYRPVAVEAVKHMIITGNTCIRRFDSGSRTAYGIRDYSVRRTIEGAITEVMLRDGKKFGNLDAAMQKMVLADQPALKEDSPVVLLTHYKLVGKRWRSAQAVNNIAVPGVRFYTPRNLPVLVLAWSLARGENYGRGLVEDNINSFHNIDVCSVALVEMIGVMADIKFLVDPGSGLDVEELNNSPRGSYHAGRRDDITTPESARRLEIGVLREIIMGWERELAQAFLLNSNSVRDAERITAEEIRFIANELESAFGGLYSRLATEWQQYEAEYVVYSMDFAKEVGGAVNDVFEILITTGLESLSRQGQLANVRAAIADLQMLEAVPEEVRSTINPMKFASFVFTNHAVKFVEFMFTQDEMKQNSEQAMQQQQQLAGIQADANVRQKAGEAAVAEES